MSVLKKTQGSKPTFRRMPHMTGLEHHSTTIYHEAFRRGLIFQPTARPCSREANIHPSQHQFDVGIGKHCVTPRQACPQPNGFRRNLRSKTRWFTGFCNSHQVSHFATFFIDARAEISVAESHFETCFSRHHLKKHRLRVYKCIS
jgi:hypothetical protein